MLSVLAITVLAVVPLQRPQGEAEYMRVNNEFRALETKLMSAIQLDQWDVITPMLAPDFAFSAAIGGKPPLVYNFSESLKAGGYYSLESYQVQHVTAHVFSPIAVVNFRLIREARVGATATSSGEFVVTDVWRQRGNAWQLKRRFVSGPMALPASD